MVAIIGFLIILLFSNVAHSEVVGPDNKLYLYYGNSIFQTHSLEVKEDLKNIIITIKTNYNYQKLNIDYNIADLIIITSKNNYIVKLTSHNKGKIFKDSIIFSADELFYDIGEYCFQPNWNPIYVKGIGGKFIGHAKIDESEKDSIFNIIISLKKTYFDGDVLSIIWGTAICGNSYFVQNFKLKIEKQATTFHKKIELPDYSHPPVIPEQIKIFPPILYPPDYGYDWRNDIISKTEPCPPSPPPTPPPVPVPNLIFITGLLLLRLIRKF